MEKSTQSATSFPKKWPARVRTGVLHAIGLAHKTIARARGWCINSRITRVRLAAELERAQTEIAQLREEIRIKDARTASIEPHRRPHYAPVERMAILEMKSARGWSVNQTAKVFLVAPATVSEWMHRLEEKGTEALVQLREPVNKYPKFVAYLVQRLRVLCPTLGKTKIAQHLARAGLHLAVTTVGRMLKRAPEKPLSEATAPAAGDGVHSGRVVTAKRPNHLWHVDLTVVPIMSGFWVPWIPFALSQRWPFCWWVLGIVDHFSRRVMSLGVFEKEPTAMQVCVVLGNTIREVGRAPKYIVSDKGPQFFCERFKDFCRHRKIRPRFGAVGKRGSIAVIERFIRSLKTECTRRIPLVPLELERMATEFKFYSMWFNAARPHQTLNGKTPNEVYYRRKPANSKPRFEPRPKWPRRSSCAAPQAIVRGRRGANIELAVAFEADRRHLPLVKLRRVA